MKERLLILNGTIELLSPALIGSGKSDLTEMDVILDSNKKPFIPATSLVGVLRHGTKFKEDNQRELENAFWGFSGDDDEGLGSALCCSDLLCVTDPVEITTREGIKINSVTGMVEKGALYDYQVIEPGARFALHMEVSIKEGDSNKNFRQMTDTLKHLLTGSNISIGAKTNNGFGRITLRDETLQEVDFSDKEHVRLWFNYLQNSEKRHQPIPGIPVLDDCIPFSNQLSATQTFAIEADLKLKNSFIIRSYSHDPQDPDAVSIKSGQNHVITGSSLRGALRARAEKILNTLEIEGAEEMLHTLFGFAGLESGEQTKEKIKGKLRVQETRLPNYPAELQTRIKIDRFTGGTVEGALFDSMPLFSTKDDSEKTVKIKLSISNYKNYEAGLLLLLLKDLWTGDLAVGGEKNIGRGVFKGCGATISITGKEDLELVEDQQQWNGDDKKTLQQLVEALTNRNEESNGN